MAQLWSLGDYVHRYDRGVADRDAMAGIGPGGYLNHGGRRCIRCRGGHEPGGNPSGGNLADPTAYFLDSLYRGDRPSANAADQDVRAQSVRILLNGMWNGDVPAPDKAYLAQLVAARTGLSQADPVKRVNDVIA